MWRLGQGGEAAGTSDPAAAGQESGAARGGLRIALLLFLFGAGLIAPALVFTGLLLERNWRAQETELERRLEQVAEDLTHDLDRELTLLLAHASALAASPEIKAANWAALHAKASTFLKPLGIETLFRDPDGQQLMNTRVPWGTPLPRSVLPDIDGPVRANLRPHVSDMILGQVAGRPVITLTAPATTDEGVLAGFLHLSVDPEHFLATMAGQNLPPAWNTGISDRKGIIIARLRRHEAFVGRPLPEELRGPGQEHAGVFRAVNVEGTPTLRAMRRSPLTGWLVSANVPLATAHAASSADGRWILGLGGGLLALALLLALVLGRMVARPIRAIADHAAMVEKEGVPPPLRSPVREANEVAAVLRATALQLQERSRALRGALERFNVALRGADIVVYATDLERRLTWISETAGPPGRFIGHRGEEVLPADSSAAAAALETRALATGEPQDGEVEHATGDTARHFRVHVEPVREPGGAIAGLLGVSLEITALKQSERRNALLARELAHRSKNLLTVVHAIATETLRDGASAADFSERFGARLRALASLQDLARAGAGGGAPLGALVQAQLEPFVGPTGGRVSAAGPEVRLTSAAGDCLAMALHELATNAAKYGALSTPQGRVAIRWRDERTADGQRRFHMTWQESGGPPVTPPKRRGFGRKVVSRLAPAAVGGEATLDYACAGVTWTLVAPWQRVVDQAEDRAADHTADPGPPAGRPMMQEASD